ncbi:MAG: 2,3,4,5-tetrahydropyridine-2,6-dicarboxylate N-succinyltransferase [Candidatus Dasytiphilus stammeri]
MHNLITIIEYYFEYRNDITQLRNSADLHEAIDEIINLLDQGTLRVAEKIGEKWITHLWIKKAIILSFCIYDNHLIADSHLRYYDKIPLKFENYNTTDFRNLGIRVVPPAIVRKGAFIAKNSILMPSYVNIGAFIDEGSMIDTWSTVGSGAQIGKNVHISGGVGIGGVLEPLQITPTIIEDNCFIGARSEIVEGVIVEEGTVISMGVYIGQSTKIYDRETKNIIYGRIPARSVVVSGTLPSKNSTYSIYCAVIVKTVDINTREKVKINNLLRNL